MASSRITFVFFVLYSQEGRLPANHCTQAAAAGTIGPNALVVEDGSDEHDAQHSSSIVTSLVHPISRKFAPSLHRSPPKPWSAQWFVVANDQTLSMMRTFGSRQQAHTAGQDCRRNPLLRKSSPIGKIRILGLIGHLHRVRAPPQRTRTAWGFVAPRPGWGSHQGFPCFPRERVDPALD